MKKTIYLLLPCLMVLFTFYSCNNDDSFLESKENQDNKWSQRQISFSEFLNAEGSKQKIKYIQKYFQGYQSDVSNKNSISWEIDTTRVNQIITPGLTTYTFWVNEYDTIEGFRNVLVKVSGNDVQTYLIHYPDGIDFENHTNRTAIGEEIEPEVWAKSKTCFKVMIITVSCGDTECEYGWDLVEVPCGSGGGSSEGGSGTGTGTGGGTSGGGSGPGTGGGGIPTGPIGHPPADGGGGGGYSQLARIEDELYDIMGSGSSDYFSFDDNIPVDSPSFNSVNQFESYLNSFINVVESKTVLNNNGNQRTLKTRVKRTPFSGLDIFTKIKKNNNVYSLQDVTSNKWGVTLGYDWDQSTFDQSTNSGIITVNIHGYEHYSVFIEGIGTIYSKYKSFQVKINATTGLLL